MLAAESLPADLRAARAGEETPLDRQIGQLMYSPEISQYLVPLPKLPPPPPPSLPHKRELSTDAKIDKGFMSKARLGRAMGRGGKGRMGRRLIRPSASTFLRVAVIVTTRISLSVSCGTKESVSGRARASGAIEDFISAT